MQKIYLPNITKDHGFNLDALAEEAIELLRNDPEQKRSKLIKHPNLMIAAKHRAKDMSVRNYFNHTDPDGFGPNWHVEQKGYTLPDWYPKTSDANSVESIGGGFSSAKDLIESLKTSPGHKMHILGLHEFFAEQINIGVGTYYDIGSKYRPIWVIITCPQT